MHDSPPLLIPIKFSHFSAAGTSIDRAAVENAVARQLAVIQQSFSGRLPGCFSSCVDTRIRFIAEGCPVELADEYNCVQAPVNVCDLPVNTCYSMLPCVVHCQEESGSNTACRAIYM
jgi:hypothetical protein